MFDGGEQSLIAKHFTGEVHATEIKPLFRERETFGAFERPLPRYD